MRSSQIRFITACQQLLALGVVLAVLTPAASIVSLDVVGQQPDQTGQAAAYLSSSKAKVPTKAVEPKVTDYSLAPEPEADAGERGIPGTQKQSVAPHELVSEPAPVVGYGAVGVTWGQGEEVAADEIAVTVRTRTGDDWSEWMTVPYDDDHDPDPTSPEARTARPGTDALLVGDVDQVQVKADAGASPLPADLTLSVIDPGKQTATAEEEPELETGTPGAQKLTPAQQKPQGQDAIALQAAKTTTAVMPTIYSRAQWGADERMRDAKSLRYGTVNAGFVHHTVNANDYTAEQVPGIIRSIYAYHVKSRGWSDIGYNYLVDRFGRIWEGRYGGIDKPVVGAHTLGYNDYSFAMSAIGNFELVQPPEVMIQAYGALFAWKLGLHGVNPASTSQQVGKKVFQAINGHRDAGSTACPGKYLYAQLPRIRALAASAQTGWASGSLQSNLAGTAYPDLVVRRASDKRGFVLPTGGLSAFAKPVTIGAQGWKDKKQVLVSADLSNDGHPDLVMTSPKGVAKIRPGNGAGRFAAVSRTVKTLTGHHLVTAVGDINRDGRNDLIAKAKGGARVDAYLGTRKGGFKMAKIDSKWGRYVALTGAGDVNGDGKADVIGRDKAGQVWLRTGRGPAKFDKSRKIVGNWAPYTQVIGGSDYTADGRPDLIGRMSNGKVYLLSGRGNGTFAPPVGALRNVAGLRDLGNAGQIAGDPAPDLIGRRGDQLVVVPNAGTFDVGNPIDTGADLSASDVLLNVGDWDRDGFGDVMTRETDGSLQLRRGDGQGHLAAPALVGTGFGPVTGLTAVGDATGDGLPDIVGTVNGATTLWPGTGMGVGPARTGGPVSARIALKYDFAPYDWVIGISDIKANGHADLLARELATGYLYVLYATDTGVSGRRFLGEGMGTYDLAG